MVSIAYYSREISDTYVEIFTGNDYSANNYKYVSWIDKNCK